MSQKKLFTPLKVGTLTAPNRIFMAPLTRLRSIEPGDIPTPLMGEYYRQRATAGLIISEATQISAQSKGYAAELQGYIAPSKSLHGKKSLQRFMKQEGVLLFNCGIPGEFLMLAFSLMG